MKKKNLILIVDDDELFQEEIKDSLYNKGYEILTTGTTKEAEKFLKIYHPDITLLDQRLPDADADGIFGFIDRMSKYSTFIVVTAYSSVDSAVEGFREGIADYLCKPISFIELFKSIQKTIKKKETENKRLKRTKTIKKEQQVMMKHRYLEALKKEHEKYDL